MSRGKASKARPAPQPTKGDKRSRSAAPPAAPAPEPVGQLLWDMPYSATAPRLINPALGLHNLVTRAGHNAGYTIDVTLLDAPDHRLIRSDVLLAHRVLDGRGEWYLSGSAWQPMLPDERVEPMGHADLPEVFADLIRPFRRRATLGPVAALTCERREFALRDDRGTTMALLRDDKVTVRRGGLTTARFREVMLTPVGQGLTAEQAAHVSVALAGAGATPVRRFPRLASRLGAPATGLTDFPAPQPLAADATFSAFVSHVLSIRLGQLLTADLSVRTDRPDSAATLTRTVVALRGELQGLASVLDEAWLEDLDEELGWLGDRPAGELRSRLRSERYLTLLDRLVTATRAPHVRNDAGQAAVDVLTNLLHTAQTTAGRAADNLALDGPAAAWEEMGRSLAALLQACEVAGYLLPEPSTLLRRRLEAADERLADALRHQRTAQQSRDQAVEASAEQAFDLGRAYERALTSIKGSRKAYLRQWAKTAKKLE